MQKCVHCGKAIKFAATGPNTSLACDAEKLLFVTESGRKTFGYLVHVCKTEGKDGEGRCEEDDKAGN